MRHAHDVIHTLTDAGVDLVGEVAVAGFTFGQTGNKGWAMLVLLNVLTGLLVGPNLMAPSSPSRATFAVGGPG